MTEIRMEPELVTEERLLDVLEALKRREPLFHRRELVDSRADFERETAEDFWETGASRRFSREFVWATLKDRFARNNQHEFEIEHWQTSDFQLREIAPRTYLLTYTLFGPGSRLTRRPTVWQGGEDRGGRSFTTKARSFRTLPEPHYWRLPAHQPVGRSERVTVLDAGTRSPASSRILHRPAANEGVSSDAAVGAA